MKVEILYEAGYTAALLGLSLSYNRPFREMPQVAARLYSRDDSEAKFLRFLVVWLDVVAPRYWWCQMDTYTIGKEQQSESTMHTILEGPLTQENFIRPIFSEVLNSLNNIIESRDLLLLKSDLPEGFLQRRILVTNYQTLRRIIRQRRNHKLPEWCEFIAQLVNQLEHQEFIGDLLFRENGSRISIKADLQ